MQGYIKLHRQLIEWEWYTDVNVFKLFIHCLLNANYQEKEWHGEIIQKGSFITSYENLSRETGLSIREVRTALNKLKTTGELTHQTTSRYSIITVKNWDLFQDNDKQCVSQATTTKEYKEIKNNTNIKKEKENFDLFFNSYPLKIDEYKTFTIYSTLLNEKSFTQEELMNGVEGYKNYITETNQEYIKSPFNWLKERGWLNDYNSLIEERKRKVPPKEKEREKDNGEYRYNPFAVL